MARKNYYAIDLIKFISAFLVIGVHTFPLLDISVTANFFVVQIIDRTAVPFFFVASAFLLFKKMSFAASMDDEANKELLKNYLWRIFKLYLVWTVLYLLITIITWIHGGFDLGSIVRLIRNFFFDGSYYHLWFLPSMIVSTCIVYYLHKKKGILDILKIAAIFYFIGMLVNVYGNGLINVPLIGMVIKAYKAVFVSTRNGLFYGFIYTTIGCLVAEKNFKMDKGSLFVRIVICGILLVIEAFGINMLGFTTDLTSMYLMLVPFSFYSFLYIVNFTSDEATPKYAMMRKLSTLLYVGHIYIVFILGSLPIHFESLIFYILVCAISFVCSYLILKLSKDDKFKLLRNLY